MSSQRVKTQLQQERQIKSLAGDASKRTGSSGIDHDYYLARAHQLRAEELMREARWVRTTVLRFVERAGVHPVRQQHYPQ